MVNKCWIRKEREGGRERGMGRKGGQKWTVREQRRQEWLYGLIFLCWPKRTGRCLYVWAWSFLVHCFPFWPSYILSFYIIYLLRDYLFIIFQALKSFFIFESSLGLLYPLWGCLQATVGSLWSLSGSWHYLAINNVFWSHTSGHCSRGWALFVSD